MSEQRAKGLFAELPAIKPDPILDLARQYRADTSIKKVDLGIGAYRTDAGKPYILRVVKEAEERVQAQTDYNHEYLPIEGYAPFNVACRALIFGADHEAVTSERITTVQGLSGTGCLRVGLEFLRRFIKDPVVLIPNPTWGNHHNIVRDAGIADARTYRYYNPQTGGLDFVGMCEDLQQAPDGSIVLLHMCAHNPTGWDPTREQWQRLAQICLAKKHLPFFDNAYQGYATGSLSEDAYSLRHFADQGMQLLCACSFAKNMGLYGERVGALHMLCQSRDESERVMAHLKAVIRPMYSSPPAHYAKGAALILTDQDLFRKWQEELTTMTRRVINMRQLLFAALVRNGCPGSWAHITEQFGMFSFTGLTARHVRLLKSRYHIYMLDNGRASMSGLTEANVEYVADAIKAVVLMDENDDIIHDPALEEPTRRS